MTTVVHCPRCGSTDAGEGASDHLPPGYWQMVCGRCGHSAMCDDWEIKFDWNSDVDTTAGLPSFVVPVDRFREALLSLREGEVPEHEPAVFPLVRELVTRWSPRAEQLSDALRGLVGSALDEVACWLSALGEAEARRALEAVPGLPSRVVDEAVTRVRQGPLRP